MSYGYFSSRFFRYLSNTAYIYCHLRAGAARYFKVKAKRWCAVCAFFLSYSYFGRICGTYFGDVTNVDSHLWAGPLESWVTYRYCKIKIKCRVTVSSTWFNNLGYRHFSLIACLYSLYFSNLYAHLSTRSSYTVKPIKPCRTLYSVYTLYSYWSLYSYRPLYSKRSLYSKRPLQSYWAYWYRKIKIKYRITVLATYISYDY